MNAEELRAPSICLPFLSILRHLRDTRTQKRTDIRCDQDFFSKAIGSVKKVSLAYGPNGKSRGEATIIFGKPDSAARAQKEYNNVGVDGRPMRVSKTMTCAGLFQKLTRSRLSLLVALPPPLKQRRPSLSASRKNPNETHLDFC